ncbi:methyltransferase domain-containing protein [Arthrospiribacter ruber]|uniref:Methyltransferase domain-containing protein n=1 Tax=Arthrospiribacter ruber TaxID=2487934 RepID=A0A951IWQ8_9BACT|nr:methyltransferase domain-containing protein [Arthrospiribacter ruber]MBW3468560.1 methyltransferase domain-containing protein [Arthrospiribacter ruber]
MKTQLDAQYWSARYEQNQTGWDVGYVTTPIKQYLDQFYQKEVKILIPGAGNAYEAKYAFENGFQNVFVLDLSPVPLQRFKKNNPGFPDGQLILGDFFEHQGEYDLILEQTFFCALDPALREKYVSKMKSLLKPGGKLVGVLFGIEFSHEGPPFGGLKEVYLNLFRKHFPKVSIEPCHNSIVPRQGSELFIMAPND